MTDNLLAAINMVVNLMQGGVYTWSKALRSAEVAYNLDYWQSEELEVIAKRQYERLQRQLSQ